MIQILSNEGRSTVADPGRFGPIKTFIASYILHQDVGTKAGRKFASNIDLLTFDYNAMVLQDDKLIELFEYVVQRAYTQR